MPKIGNRPRKRATNEAFPMDIIENKPTQIVNALTLTYVIENKYVNSIFVAGSLCLRHPELSCRQDSTLYPRDQFHLSVPF